MEEIIKNGNITSSVMLTLLPTICQKYVKLVDVKCQLHVKYHPQTTETLIAQVRVGGTNGGGSTAGTLEQTRLL